MSFKTLQDVGEVKGKKALVRVDFNVPMKDGKVVDGYRIEKTLPTINLLREKGAKVLLMGHIEFSPLEKVANPNGKATLRPVVDYLAQYFPVKFAEDFFGNSAQMALSDLQDGEVVLFENLRNDPGEEENDQSFAKNLAALGDFYVGDAFSAAHRKHASIVGVPRFLPSYAGLLMQSEIENISQVFNPPHPFLFILGGAKFDTKLPLIQKFLTLAEHVFVGGALANNFFLEKKLNIGTSLVSKGDFNIKDLFSDQRLVIPTDVTVLSGNNRIVKKPEEVLDNESILDAGPESVELIRKMVEESKCVLWNGPLGNYEKGFVEPTNAVATMLAENTAKGVKTIVGGADTLASISSTGAEEKISFISTGGGAMLQYLLDETLPGIEALEEKTA